MRWPWVSVYRLDDMRERLREAQEANDWLRRRNMELTDSLVRVQRTREGLPEQPRKPREQTLQTMPKELRDYTKGFENSVLGKEIRRSLRRRHSDGESWRDIMLDVLGPPPSEGEDDEE